MSGSWEVYFSRNCYLICLRMASDSGPPGSNYFILLILTDGIITDMQQTCEAIVNVRSDITTCLASTVRTCLLSK